MELIVLALIAGFVFFKLFSVLGKQTGAPPPVFREDHAAEDGPRPVHVSTTDEDQSPLEDEMVGDLQKIAQKDPNFSQREFVTGAKAAYEMIVKAFSEGDHDTLQSLLTPDVYRDYEAAIKARESDGTEPFELMRLKSANLEGGELKGSMAEVGVVFEAELSDGEKVMKTKELWTFERDTDSRDPNWRLSDVSAA